MTEHGRIRLVEENCTACNICARECPTWCISVTSHPEPLPGSPPGPRQRTCNVLDEFTLDWAACMFCGICIEECPFGALEWTPDELPAAREAAHLRHDRHSLGAPAARGPTS